MPNQPRPEQFPMMEMGGEKHRGRGFEIFEFKAIPGTQTYLPPITPMKHTPEIQRGVQAESKAEEGGQEAAYAPVFPDYPPFPAPYI